MYIYIMDEFNRCVARDFATFKCPSAFIRTHNMGSASNESLFTFNTFALGLISICFRYVDTYIGLYFLSDIA